MVILFCRSVTAVYLQPQNPYAQKRGNFFGCFNAMGIPSLNLLMYTLRNKEVKGIQEVSGEVWGLQGELLNVLST